MKLEEIPEGLRNEYEKKCGCGNIHKALTQRDSFPEYYTEIYIQCNCGDYVEFNLPVN